MPAAWKNDPVRRSLWTGAPILNMAVNARAERLLGVQADSLVYDSYFITSRFTYNLRRWSRAAAGAIRASLPGVSLGVPALSAVSFLLQRAACSVPAAAGEFPAEELQMLRKLGKEVFFWTYGADVRTRETTRRLGEPNCCTHCPAPGVACVCDDGRGQANVARIAGAATAVFAMGDMIEYTPGSRNDLFFWPVDLDADGGRKLCPALSAGRRRRAAADRPRPESPPLQRHLVPPRRGRTACARQGHAIELVLVEGVPNDRALELYRTADLVFDQCLIGFHGYFALEAMAMGKPVVCFIRKPREYLLRWRGMPDRQRRGGPARSDPARIARRPPPAPRVGTPGTTLHRKSISP